MRSKPSRRRVQASPSVLGGLAFQDERDLVRDIVDAVDLKRKSHPFFRAKRVDENGKRGRFFPRAAPVFQQQRLATAGRLHLPVGEGGDFKLGAHRLADADEFATDS